MDAQPTFFNALPPYLGGKRRLAPLIFAALERELPRTRWSSSVLVDPFCGGGAVAVYAKAQGFHVTASDLATRAATVARALVANSSVTLHEHDVIRLFEEPGGEYTKRAAEEFRDRFTLAQAEWTDRALAQCDITDEPVRSLLRLVVIKQVLHLWPLAVANATDAPHAAADDFDRVSPRRVGHYLSARQTLTPSHAWGVAQAVNRGVFGGAGEARQGDALDVISSTNVDVLYLDPPYAQTSAYASTYAALDTLLGADLSSAAVPTLDQLLAAAAHVPHVVLSYGGPTVTLESLTAAVERHRPVRRAVAIRYPHLRSLATKEKNDANREFLVIASR